MAVVVTYTYPVAGTTPPTLLQALNANMVNAVVTALDADTVITITHNFKMSTAELANKFPTVLINVAGDSTTTINPLFLVALTDSSTVTINKPTTVGTQGTFVVVICRPNTITR